MKNSHQIFNLLKITAAATACSFSIALADEEMSPKCVDEFAELPNKKIDFDVNSLAKDLGVSIGRVKMCDIPILGIFLCPGTDDKVTESGINVGCLKEVIAKPGAAKKMLTNDLVPNMLKAAAADKLGVDKSEVPTDVNQLKGFAMEIAPKKAAEFLGADPAQVPTDFKGLEKFVSLEVKKQAAEKLGVDKSEIPTEKSQLSAFVKIQAQQKFAEELDVDPSQVNLSSAGLKEISGKNEKLAQTTNLVRAANVLEMMNLLNGAEPLLTNLKPILDMLPGDAGAAASDGVASVAGGASGANGMGGIGGGSIGGGKSSGKSDDDFFRLGFRLGANYSIFESANLQTADMISDMGFPFDDYNTNILYKTGFQGGVVFNIGYFQTGAMLVQKGAIIEENFLIDNWYYGYNTLYVCHEITLYFLELPLMFSYRIPLSNSLAVSLDAGLYVAKAFKQERESSKYELSGTFDSDEVRDRLDDLFLETNFDSGDYGLSIGGGFEYDDFYFGLFYKHGLAETMDKALLRSFGANVGYNF